MFDDIFNDLLNIKCNEMEIKQITQWKQAKGQSDYELEHVKDNNKFRIIITQNDKERTFRLSSENELKIDEVFLEFINIETLIMLFEGIFWNIKEITFSPISPLFCDELAEECKRRRLSYFETDKLFFWENQKLVDFSNLLTNDLLNKWEKILEDLDIIHQMYLYNLAETKIPKEIKLATMIEVFEPLVELIGEHESFFPALTPGERNTTLKMCVDATISKYGKDIFEKEYLKNKDAFLQIVVNSRNRIMHIKRKMQGKKCFNGCESLLYMVKFSLLYRVVLLNLLGIDCWLYKDNIISIVNSWHNWEINNSEKPFYEFLRELGDKNGN